MQSRSGAGASRAKYNYSNHTKSNNYNRFKDVKDVKFSELRVPSSVQRFNTEVGLHPTQKPVALCSYLIKTYTNEGETVLDNCMGSGSTGVACIETGRNFIGIEKEEKYFSVAKERIDKALTMPRQGELQI
jgi:site-specific DNA-methyltransferase (adenine-specific)